MCRLQQLYFSTNDLRLINFGIRVVLAFIVLKLFNAAEKCCKNVQRMLSKFVQQLLLVATFAAFFQQLYSLMLRKLAYSAKMFVKCAYRNYNAFTEISGFRFLVSKYPIGEEWVERNHAYHYATLDVAENYFKIYLFERSQGISGKTSYNCWSTLSETCIYQFIRLIQVVMCFRSEIQRQYGTFQENLLEYRVLGITFPFLHSVRSP